MNCSGWQLPLTMTTNRISQCLVPAGIPCPEARAMQVGPTTGDGPSSAFFTQRRDCIMQTSHQPVTRELLTLGIIAIVTVVSIRQHHCFSLGEAEWQVRHLRKPPQGDFTRSLCRNIRAQRGSVFLHLYTGPQCYLYQIAWKGC